MNSKIIYSSPNYEKYKFKSKRIFRIDGEYEPFVYIIQEIKTGMMYIGSHTRKNCLENHLGTKYYTSSKYVKWKEDLSSFEIYKIVSCLSNHDAIILESELIKKHNAVWDKLYYNRHDPHIGFNISGIKRSKETKQKISLANSEFYKNNEHHMKGKSGTLHNNYGKRFSEKARKNMSECRIGDKHHLFDKSMSEETKQKISNSKKGKPPWNKGKIGIVKLSEETKNKLSKQRKGRNHSNSTIKKISESRKSTPKKKCPFCGRLLDPGNYKQFHGEKCKLNINLQK